MVERERIDLGKSALKLLGQLAFAAVFLIITAMITINPDNQLHYSLFGVDVFNSSSWFVGYYFAILILGALFINKFLQRLDQKQYGTFIVVLLAIVSFWWTRQLLSSLMYNFDVAVLGVFFYSLGGYMKKYGAFGKVRLWAVFAVILTAYLFVWISQWNGMYYQIENYVRAGSTGEFSHSISTYEMYNPVVIVLSVSIFELFRRLPSFHSKLINFLGSAVFMVYLIHDNTFFYQIWDQTEWLSVLNDSVVSFVFYMVRSVLVVFAIGMAVYAAYLLLGVFYRKFRFIFVKAYTGETE